MALARPHYISNQIYTLREIPSFTKINILGIGIKTTMDMLTYYNDAFHVDDSEAIFMQGGNLTAPLYPGDPGFIPHLMVDTTGNVGIRTASPKYELDVDGDIRLQGSIFRGVDDEEIVFGGLLTQETIRELKADAHTPTDMSVKIWDGRFVTSCGTETLEYAGGDTPNFVAANPGMQRYDLILINDSGTLSISEGAEEAVNPNVPLYPASKQVIAYVGPITDSTASITNAMIHDVRFFLNLGGGGGGSDYREQYVVGTPSGNYNGSATVFDMINSYILGEYNLKVYYDGVLMSAGASDDYLETGNEKVTFNYSLLAGRVVTMVWGLSNVGTSVVEEKREDFVAGAAQTAFNLNDPYIMGENNLSVYVDGSLQTPTVDYNETDWDSITFTAPMVGGERVSCLFNKPAASANSKFVNDKYILDVDSDEVLESDIMQTNLLDNGGFEIWQRGAGPFVSSYIADRWWINGANITVNREAVAADVYTGSYSVEAVTTGASMLQYGTGTSLVGIETPTYYKNKKLSLSCAVKTSTASAVRVAIYCPEAAAVTEYSDYHTGSGNWEQLTTTILIPAAPTVIYVRIYIDVACTAYIDNAMLIVGQYPMQFRPSAPAENWERCQRYYETNTGIRWFFNAANTSVHVYTYGFNVIKAAAPTCTLTGGALGNIGSIGINASNIYGASLEATPSGAGYSTVTDATLVAEVT